MSELSRQYLEEFSQIAKMEYPHISDEDITLFIEDLYKFWEEFLFDET